MPKNFTISSRRLIILAAVSLTFLGSFYFGFGRHARKVLKVGLSANWKLPLHPGLQHTIYEGVLLSHEFESLVARGDNGLVLPLAARSFEYNHDYTTLTFLIDRNRQFSNGVHLEAAHFKQSWEKSLLMQPNSTKNSQTDILAQTVGFENFRVTGKLDGVKVLNPDTLEITFRRPFRMALLYLAGASMGAYLEYEGRVLGTGPYIISHQSERQITFVKSKFSSRKDAVDQIEVIYTKDPIGDLKLGNIDVIAFNMQKVLEDENIKSTKSQEIGSLWLHLNGLPGRIFESIDLRRAMQSLVWDILKNNPDISGSLPRRIRPSMQVYLPFQAGRLPDEEVENLVSSGRSNIETLIQISKRTPIKFGVDLSAALSSGTPSESRLISALEQRGLQIEKVIFEKRTDAFKDFYHTNRSDVILLGASLNFVDPDGLYQIFGREGSVTATMVQRKRLTDLLENGRSLVNGNDIKAHYEQVNRSVLTEVPSVHMGIILNNYVYREDRVQFRRAYLERHHELFDVFIPIR